MSPMLSETNMVLKSSGSCFKGSLKSVTVFLILVVILLQVSIKVDASYIGDVVQYCRNKEKRFAAIEDNYVRQSPPRPDEPQLSAPPFPEQQRQLYQLELSQRPFECIADILHIYSDVNFYSSRRYRSLVLQCRAAQPTTPECDPFSPYTTYRNINGTCNNIFYPKWGGTFGCYRRLWPANYEGVSGLRKSVKDKMPLPNTRDISRELIKAVLKTSKVYNALFAFVGQPIAHDLSQFPFTLVNGTRDLACCKYSTEEDLHPQCAPIFIDSDDPFYSAQNVQCFDVIRVVSCDTCSLKKRIPINFVTGWLDCSFVYGNTYNKAQELRRNDGSGKLISQERNLRELLPPDTSRDSLCGNAAKDEYCFSAGDTRINQQTPLMLFHTLLFREHNRIAQLLNDMNPIWDDEILYQESRKIVIAEWQVIIYKEYLPVLLGPRLMQEYRLNIGSRGIYNPSLNPSISVEFEAASFRLHPILPGIAVHGENDAYLRDLYINAIPLYNGQMSEYLFNMARTDASNYDRFMPRDVTNFLNKRRNGTYGFDLGAIDIQRGRDVGLPTYAQAIEYMENRPGTITSFNDLNSYMRPQCRTIIQRLYEDVRDVDFFVGIICEKIPMGMIISPTAARIIAEQFGRLKYGDKFYVEFDNTLHFEKRQTLMNASFAKLTCDNTEVGSFQPFAFLFPSQENVLQSCSEIPGVDLSKWAG